MTKISGRVVTVLATLGLIASTAYADEIVHFTNGAEMPVRSHSVDKEQSMVRLDLGGNSFISFPMTMVDKIVNAGQDVFLNPVFHPANQAIGGVPGTAIADTTVRGNAGSVGFKPQPDGKGHAGVMLGEAADAIPAGSVGGPQMDNTVAASRKRFNPAFPPAPGGQPQVIMPNNMQVRPPTSFQMNPAVKPAPEPTPPAPQPQENPPSDPPAEDPPDNP
jgi:hypothetical protein